MEDIQDVLRNRVRIALADSRLNQKQFAEVGEINYQRLRNWLAGQERFGQDIIRTISEMCD